jgi:hypothetical protein
MKERGGDPRDTLKVTGAVEADQNKATFGIFYVSLDDPLKGGTGRRLSGCADGMDGGLRKT